MAYVNVAEWKTGQVCEWLKGLEHSVLPYVHSFCNHNVNGQQLLNLRPEDLNQLGVSKLGHQEVILEAVEYLRNFHYELDRENLQLLSLRLSCLAHSLFNELSRQTDSQPVSTQTLSDVASIVSAVKPLACWLDRPPFSGQLEYNDKKTEMLKLSLEMATCAQRDRFVEKPIEEIRTTCGQMAKLADYIIQDIADPMILQPASLDLATLKKRPGDDLGFNILPSFHGAHQIHEIKFGSAAHQCGKMEEGDEIVQVNYQTVVGWERKNVLELFRESPTEVLLTLKRRPRHTKVYGQIYIKPYRLPSNKKTPYTSRWHHNLPSPRPELLTIPDFTMPLPRNTPKDNSLNRPEPAMIDTVDMLDNLPTDSSDSDSEIEPPSSVRLYLAKPRNTVQRRATITGASPTTKHGIDIERFWRELKQEHSSSFQLRDKAASCAHGLNNVQANLRPQTCLGIEQRKKRYSQIEEKKVQFQEEKEREEKGREDNKDWDNKVLLDETNSDSRPGFDSKFDSDPKTSCDSKTNCDSKRNSPERNSEPRRERGKLDKSHSTPAYDLNSEESFDQKFNSSNLKSEGENIAHFRDSGDVKIVVGSVVKKIHEIEKHLMQSSEKIYVPKGPGKKSPKAENPENTSTSSEDSFSKENREGKSATIQVEEEIEIESKERNLNEKEIKDSERKDSEIKELEIKESESGELSPKLTKKSFPEVTPRVVPPEPPPRKYFSKPAALNLNVNSELQERPKVPERQSLKMKETPKKEEFPERRRSGFESYSEFADKSSDFIDEDLRLDAYGYSQIYDSYSKDEKLFHEKYEPFVEKFSLMNERIAERPDILDSTDGVGCSKQTLEKPRTLEKDRGVVNRAMMVARSIGLHSKTLGSPKNSRKRNTTLAKRRHVSVKEISPGDLDGFLTYRSRGARGAWARAWFILKGHSLFRFKNQESTKADCVISLTGFTASQATEVKSRKFAFKIYHTGTVFYFATDTEDSLMTWLDAVSKTTLGADTVDRTSGLFSETDESDVETKGKMKSPDGKDNKGFGSLKKSGKKEQNFKEQALPAGASLDRKYIKFLGKSQNVPVPTAQFRSYRRVLPNSTPNRKQDAVPLSTELPVTIAGSTFYGLNASRSANDVPSSSQDMGDYRRTSERFPRTRRNDELQGFITLEEFMLARQDEDHQRGTPSPRFTPLTSDHVHIQHRTFDNLESARMRFVRDIPNNNGVIYGFPKNYDETSSTSGSSYGIQTPTHTFERRTSERSSRGTRESIESKGSTPRTLNCMRKKKSSDGAYYDSRQDNRSNLEQQTLSISPRRGTHGQINPADYGCEYIGTEFRAERSNFTEMGFSQRRIAKNDVYSGSSGDLACHASSDILQVPKASVNRNGSFNLADCRRDRNQDKKLSRFDRNRLKHVTQYQPPPIPNSPYEQEGMKAAFEMHLDKGEDVQKRNKLKNFFSNMSPQKPSALEIPKDPQKTLLGSPRLHRALFKDKATTQPKMKRSGSQSPGDSGISQSLSSSSASQSQTLSQSFSSVSSASDWSPEAAASHGLKCSTGHGGCQKRSSNSRNFTSPPTLPYIPPPTSPPPDYPGLEYPPVFEPGTYSLSDASLLRSRNNSKNS